MQSRSADEIYRMLTKAYAESTELIRKYYNFTPQEFRAYRLYSKIAMYSAYWNTSAFRSIWRRNSARRKSFGFCGKSRRRIFAPDCGTKEMR